MNLDSLHKLYVHELKDLYSAENQILEALPKLIEAAQDSNLQAALEHHLGETKTQVKRLKTIFSNLDFEPGGHHCKGMNGLIDEGKDLLSDVKDSEVVDAAIVSACQRVEHYEMAAYGVARAFAKKLGRDQDIELLTESLEEEGAADRKLTSLAEHHINFVATTA
jgi:ferritin-like metal-binding protein YciE